METIKRDHSSAISSLQGIDTSSFPKHIAIIPDGNRRWARKKGGSAQEGHEAGADNMIPIVRAAQEYGVEEITFYVFSTENWLRHSWEVRTLFFLFRRYLVHMCTEMLEEGIAFHAIGDLSQLPSSLIDTIHETEAKTSRGNKIKLILGFNYGGRDEIRRAMQKILDDYQQGNVHREQITESLISNYMDTASFFDPELIIRTGGEQRLSNFLLWQSSYAELYTFPLYWPDFTRAHLLHSFQEYQKRERRMGGV